MPAAAAVAVGTIGSGLLASRSAKKASQAQSRAAQQGTDYQKQMFDETKEMLSPFVTKGYGATDYLNQYYGQAGEMGMPILQQFAQSATPALQGQQAMLGLRGPEEQQMAIEQVEQSPEFQEMVRQGEEAILANASATGGLRGGNTQAALAQFRPAMLNELMNQRYGRLGSMAAAGGNTAQYLTGVGQTATSNVASLGQASAARTGSAAQQTAANVGDLMGDMGAAQAGYKMAQGKAIGDTVAGLGNQFGAYLGRR